ncbi:MULTISPECIES: hypothetical protein [Halomonadaceae]|uniref:hypothetical protein n=1 Tax=Halomonadaceae TaxID=28256 RepID=UPI00159A16E5|nr:MULTISPECIES: hypothetical protein [Halomonas]QJQ94626.1 hypothetical protein HIO72_04570 [Halomonas sp. PA5]
MLKPPITISIVPSNWALVSQAGLAGAIVLLLLMVAPLWHAAGATLLLGAVMIRWRWSQPTWQLRRLGGGVGASQWEWRETASQGEEKTWQRAQLQVIYLGPWLIGLKLNGRLYWLWPDSGNGVALWELRRELLFQTHDTSLS